MERTKVDCMPYPVFPSPGLPTPELEREVVKPRLGRREGKMYLRSSCSPSVQIKLIFFFFP